MSQPEPPRSMIDDILTATDDYFLATDHPDAPKDADGGRANLVDVIGKLADGVHRIADTLGAKKEPSSDTT
jgi:hypothetical protein